MTINGKATSEGTAHYRERFSEVAAQNHFRFQQNLWLSSIGIGTYLGNADGTTDDAYIDSIKAAISLGANVIDCAANYRFQRSERSIGKALQQLNAREELVICTKGGYLPFDGAPPRNVAQYVNETFVKPGIASFEDFVGGGHCMTPAYLQNQLDQSLRNMGVEYVDVYYIHNPESQLPHVSEQEFYARLKRAFEGLEENRKQGKLVHYGVATWNGFRMPPNSGQHHSLTRMVELAREVAGEEHGFHFIQLPFNARMPEGATVIEEAQRLGVSVVTSASLLQGRIPPQMAIEFVRSTPGITTALIGMSRVEHVEENLAADSRG